VTSRLVFPVMGTMSSIVVAPDDEAAVGPEVVRAALGATRSRLEELDRRFSHYRGDSDISRWVAGEHVDPYVAQEIRGILRECGRLHRESDGVFRARNPRTGALDTAGYVKGYAIGRAVEVMRAYGLHDFVVGVGGDAYLSGRASVDRPWRVAIQDPGRSHAVAAMVEACDGAVASSGTAERGHHIWRGDAEVHSGLASFTVIGPDVEAADAYATIGFAMGEDGVDWVARHEGYRSIVIRADGSAVGDAALVSAA
jgi:FAD:protein FMN transferase